MSPPSENQDPFKSFKSDDLEGQQVGDRRERFMRDEKVEDVGFQRHTVRPYAPPSSESRIRRVVRGMMSPGPHR